MKGRAFIDALRGRASGLSVFEVEAQGETLRLLADAVEEADASCKSTIELGCVWSSEFVNRWYDTRQDIAEDAEFIGAAVSYLNRRGLIEKKEDEPHMVRFVECAF